MEIQVNIIGSGETAEAQKPDGALSQIDRDDIRAAVLEAAQLGRYMPGMAEALIADLKTIKTAS